MIDTVQGQQNAGGDRYDQMIDSVSDQNRPQSSILNPITGKQLADATANALPMGGMMAGAAASLPFAPAAGPFAPLVPVVGAAIGYGGGEGWKQVYQQLTGNPDAPKTSEEAISRINAGGLTGATGQMMGTIASPYIAKGLVGGTVEAPQLGEVGTTLKPREELGGLAGAIQGAATRFGKQFAGINETVGRYILGRGTGNVLTHENMTPGATENALESAQSFLSGVRQQASQNVGDVENAIIASGQGDKMFDTSGMAANLRAEMLKRGISPESSTVGLANGKGLGILNEAQALLDKGKLSGSELINVKRLLDSSVDYSGARLPEIDSLQSGIIKGVAGAARQVTNTGYPDLGEANAAAHSDFALYDKYRQFLGQSATGPEAKASADTLRRLTLSLSKNPKVATELASDFGQAGGEAGSQIGQSLFDTIAAQHYTPHSPVLISPSSPVLKALSTVGLTGPQVAGAALKAAGAASRSLQDLTPMVPAGTTMAFTNALQNHMSPESISAFYRSPGDK